MEDPVDTSSDHLPPTSGNASVDRPQGQSGADRLVTRHDTALTAGSFMHGCKLIHALHTDTSL
jgi:hypothetical protein